uniref:Uncharacterized protein n=1 Tax=Arundo donax TaxID=35708 RepID=A0A0A9FDD7_ARUDO
MHAQRVTLALCSCSLLRKLLVLLVTHIKGDKNNYANSLVGVSLSIGDV